MSNQISYRYARVISRGSAKLNYAVRVVYSPEPRCFHCSRVEIAKRMCCVVPVVHIAPDGFERFVFFFVDDGSAMFM